MGCEIEKWGTRWDEMGRTGRKKVAKHDAICVELTSVYSKRGDEKREREGKKSEECVKSLTCVSVCVVCVQYNIQLTI